MTDDLPLDPFPFDPEGPNAGNRGRILFTQLVRAFADATHDNDLHTAASALMNGVDSMGDDDLRSVVKFAVGLVAAQELGLGDAD